MKNDPQTQQPQVQETPQVTETPVASSSWAGKLNQFSAVATAPQHKKFIVLFFSLFIIGVTYLLTLGHTPSPQELKEQQASLLAQKKQEVVKSSTPVTPAINLSSPSAVAAPDVSLMAPQVLQDPTPPAPPVAPLPPAPAAVFSDDTKPLAPAQLPPVNAPAMQPANMGHSSFGSILTSDSEKEEAEAAKKVAKRSSGIMVFGGASSGIAGTGTGKDGKSTDAKSTSTSSKSNSEFLGFGNGGFDATDIQKTSAANVTATSVGDTNNRILQGKVINAILETAINTDLPGSLRAVIVRDVYADSGKKILIPKGSRAIGSYNNSITGGQVRVQVTWSRVIRPDGIDIAINSIGTDSLGRSGVIGKLDSKIWTQLGTALLVSYIIPNVANKITGVADKQITSTISTDASSGNTVTTSSGSTDATSASGAATQFSSVAQNAINSAFPITPTITVNQGTLITILVQSDLIFPDDAALAARKVLK